MTESQQARAVEASLAGLKFCYYCNDWFAERDVMPSIVYEGEYLCGDRQACGIRHLALPEDQRFKYDDRF